MSFTVAFLPKKAKKSALLLLFFFLFVSNFCFFQVFGLGRADTLHRNIMKKTTMT